MNDVRLMKYLQCSFPDLLALPADYVEVIVEEATREAQEQKRASQARGRPAARRR